LKHPVTIHALNDSLYQRRVKDPATKSSYLASFGGFFARHAGTAHGVFDAEGRLIHIGRHADLEAAHHKHQAR